MIDRSNGFGLLSEEQVFGDRQIAVIGAMGTQCAATDYAVATGTEISEDGSAGEGALPGGFPGRWFLSSPAGGSDVRVVTQKGTPAVAYASSSGGVRPVMACADLPETASRIASDISGFSEAEHGEYPQDAAGRSIAGKLEAEHSAHRLRKTGKTYAAQFDEYVFEGRKYIRAVYAGKRPQQLSDGREYDTEDPVWIEVKPVRWIWDPQAQLLVSKRILTGGIRYCAGSSYDGDFGSTVIAGYLRTAFAKELEPSAVGEMTDEERAAMEAETRRAEKRSNPFGFRFGEVTEEDIIRGAIESDIPVFLHGPSSEGKSARVKQIDPTCELIYLRNATPDSLNGRSVYNQSTGEMIDIPPTWYKKVVAKCEAEPDTFHVVFFDEINNALPSIQGMAFNIVLDREVNGLWRLPPNARVVAAGNDMQDSLAANQIAAPFFNRFAHVYINTTTEKWLKWARENQIHPAIYSFIAYKRGETLRSTYTGEKPNADPRKWEMASRMLYATGQPEMLRALIGEDITDEFVRFCNQPVITLESVLAGDYEEAEIAALNTAERYATTIGLSQAEEKDLETVREFAGLLGEEFRAVLDSMRACGPGSAPKNGR